MGLRRCIALLIVLRQWCEFTYALVHRSRNCLQARVLFYCTHNLTFHIFLVAASALLPVT